MTSTNTTINYLPTIRTDAHALIDQTVTPTEVTKLLDVNAQNLRSIRSSPRRSLGRTTDAARKRYLDHMAQVTQEAGLRISRGSHSFTEKLWALAKSAGPEVGWIGVRRCFMASLAELRAYDPDGERGRASEQAAQAAEQTAASTRKRLTDKLGSFFKFGVRRAARANENAECELARRRMLTQQQINRRAMRDELANGLETVLKTLERAEEGVRAESDGAEKALNELLAADETGFIGQLLPVEHQAEKLVAKSFTPERVNTIVQDMARRPADPDGTVQALREAVKNVVDRAAVPDTIAQFLISADGEERTALLRDQRILATELTPTDPDCVEPGREQRRLRVEIVDGASSSPLVPMLDAMNVEGTERRQLDGDPREMEIICENRGLYLAEIREVRAAESHIGGGIQDSFWEQRPTFIKDKTLLRSYRPDQPRHESGGAHVLHMGLILALISRTDDQVYHPEGDATGIAGLALGTPLARGYEAAVEFFAGNRVARDGMAGLVGKKKAAMGAAAAYTKLEDARNRPEDFVPKTYAKQLVASIDAEIPTLNLRHVLSETAVPPKPKPVSPITSSPSNNGDGKHHDNEPAALAARR